ncbi:MAG: elongation factor G, partial [Planctomycetota bacterium]
MSDRQTADIRNVAIAGHGGAGKTTLVDHLLAEAGAVQEPGDVEEGDSLSDSSPEEKERGFSIDNSMFHFDWDDHTFNIIDTPGYIEFEGTAVSALPAVETALIAVDAKEGIQINTRQMWERAGELGKARALVITHIDGDNVRYQELLDEIQDVFGRQCAPLFLPVGLGEEVSGVVDLLSADEAPDGVVGDFSGLHEELVESVIESDDELMERYLEGEEIEDERLRDAFREAVAAGEVAPILCCCAPQQVGLEELLQFMGDCLPSPLDVPAPVAQDEEGNEVEVEQDADSPLCAWVFKSVTDVHVGKLGFFRVFGGTVKRGQDVQIARTGDTARMGHIYHVFGEEQEEAETGTPGDILCMSKVEEVELNDTLCEPEQRLSLPAPEAPNPMVSLAVVPESREDEEKVGEGLQELVARDPGLNLRRDERSSELVLSGLSNLHLEVTLSRLKRQYGVEVSTRPPTIPYQETITDRAKGHHRHKKQTGGRGQYGEVYLVVEPLERGEGFEFLDETKGGVIPRQFLPSVEKGIKEAMEDGLMADFPVV